MRVVLTTFGSLGDLHPYLAVALELKRRGHAAVLATSGIYQSKIEAEGIEFAALRPDASAFGTPKELMAKVFDVRRGPEFILRSLMMPHLRETYEDLARATEGADLLVSHVLTFAAPLLAEKRGLPWVSTILAPLSLFSAYDPPVLPPFPGMVRLRALGSRFHRLLFRLMRRMTREWTRPVHDLRRELGLPASGLDPLYEGQFSPYRTLALFSPTLASPQPDWPPNMVVTGFAPYDRREKDEGLPSDLAHFLDVGPPPIVFTLGSSAVLKAGRFYAESAEAARRLGRRAVLLIGNDPSNLPTEPLGEGIAAFEYAPYSELFPRAVAIVHQGGIGTTAQAMRSGRPMLCVPFGFDQPDNAARVARLGVARILPRERYHAAQVVPALKDLLTRDEYARKAQALGKQVRLENGAALAVNELEAVLRAARR